MTKWLVTVAPANRPEWEGELDDDDFESAEQMSEFAREKWNDQTASEVELHVSIQKAEWLASGAYGSGDESEEAMLARMQREAEEAAGLA